MDRTYQTIADFHCHTVASTHAFSTVTELAEAAAKKGMVAIGCTDHGIGLPDAPHIWHFVNLRTLPDKIAGVRVLRGVEANVLDAEGHLDMPEDVLDNLELVVASMHRGVMPSGSVEDCTAAWLAVIKNPYVDIIGHSGSPAFAYDYETVIQAAGRNGKAIEINENTFLVRKNSVHNCGKIAELCKKYAVPISLDSDAHYHLSVGNTPNCIELLREVDFPPELIMNGSIDALNRFFERRHIAFG